MKASVVFPLLLLVWVVTPDQIEAYEGDSDVNAVLRELTASLAQQRVEIEYLQKENKETATKLEELKTQRTELEELKQQLEVEQVAFSASLALNHDETVGPLGTFTTLIFKHVTTNIGDAYNQNTGVFTAPVKGAYHFEWHIGGFGHKHHPTGAVLVKNAEHIFSAYEHLASHFASASNAATLLLDVGDVVYVRLFPHNRVFDNINRHTTFSGHLLFPM